MMHIKRSTGQESRFEIQTPSAISAARGTRFRVSVDKEEITRTEVLEGIVGVKGMGQEISLNLGQGTLVRKGMVPGTPKRLLPPPSPSVTFDVRVNPLPPFIQKPLEGQEVRTDTVSLEWLTVPDAASYQVQVALDPDFKEVQMDLDGITGTGKKRLGNFISFDYRRDYHSGSNRSCDLEKQIRRYRCQ